ncbi:MAG TPA: hypothetical protein VMR86_13930, partial [Myxococcota bacterium]|nr:hypothetical protein [Myxococcota bacterium]
MSLDGPIIDPVVASLVRSHVESFFAGHRVGRREFNRGPIHEVAPGFHVLAVSPGPKTALWSFISVGAFVTKEQRPKIEFLIIAREDRSE